MSNITTFNFSPSLSLRAIDIAGAPWFIAKDICDALGMRKCPKRGYADWLRGLDAGDVSSPAQCAGVKIPGTGMQYAKLINESGLYCLILKSRKPEAKAFKRWVTSEVLPAIRKTGQFSMQTQAEPLTVPVEKYAALVDEVVKLAHQCMDMAQQALQRGAQVPALSVPTKALKLAPRPIPAPDMTRGG